MEFFPFLLKGETKMKKALTTIIGFSLISCATVVGQGSEDEQAWGKVINLAEALIGEGSFLDATGAEGKLDALIDLHVAFCAEMTGKRIPSQRVVATKQGMRLFLKTAGERYEGDKRKAVLRLLRDLATNRAVFIEILTSDSPSEVIEQQMMAYLERNQGMSYKDPVPIPDQISVPQADTPLEIIEEGIRLVSDSGTSGHYNEAVDAGEVISLNIPLKNISDSPFRSTSGFLQTQDRYVRVGNSEVLYTERSEIDGQTVTFAPGKSITPSQHFVFSLSPDCPDGHKIDFILLAWDSDRGKHEIPFEIVAYNIGPLTFGSAKIDDDIPGRSDGNGNQLIEVGETIEYVLAVKNQGHVDINDIRCTLFADEPALTFKAGDEILQYSSILAKSEKPIPANFVFTVQEEGKSNFSDYTTLRLFSAGESRSNRYSWIKVSQISIKVNDQQWAFILSQANKMFKNGQHEEVMQLLHGLHVSDRMKESEEARKLRSEAIKLNNIKGRPIYAFHSAGHHRIQKHRTWDIIDVEKSIKNTKGLECKIKIRIYGKQQMSRNPNSRYPGAPKYHDFTRNVLRLSVDAATHGKEFGYRGNNEFVERQTIPFERGYVDLGEFRFIYTYHVKNRYITYYVFLYHLGYGKDGIPTSVEDPETFSTSMGGKKP